MENKGITLVALVIMIILLLILASVTILSFTGSNVFEKAERARDEYGTVSEEETQKIKDYEKSIEDTVENVFPTKWWQITN